MRADHWGTVGSGDGQFIFPFGVGVDGAGDVYVADSSNDRIQKFTSTGAFVTKWGSNGSADGQFNNPRGVAVDAAGDVYVADTGNNRIQKFTSTGTFVTTWGSFGTNNGEFHFPFGPGVDAAGNVYVADQANRRIQKFTSTGTFITTWGTFGTLDGQFNAPTGIAVDAGGSVYVSDAVNQRVQKFTDTGAFVTKWGSNGNADGQFVSPIGVGVDGAGDMYVADLVNNRIQKFTPTGTFLTKWGSFGSADGQFSFPQGVAVDGDGDVYVADTGNSRVQKFKQLGSITVVKDAVNDSPQDFVFTLGQQPFALDDDSDSGLANTITFDGLAPGTYVVREGPTQGWQLTNLVCNTGEIIDLTNRRAVIDVGIGEEDVTCTFTNTQPATVTVVKNALPDDPQDFAFTGGLGAFSLDDDADATLPRLQSFTRLPGTYAVTETGPPAGWVLTGLSCTTGEQVSLATRTATVTLTPGEQSVCTFTDTKQLRPDALIALAPFGPYVGDNVYQSALATTQVKSRTVLRGHTGTFFVRVQNDSVFPDSIKVKGSASSPGFGVRYFNASTNADITAAVTAGTFTYLGVAPGGFGSPVIKVVVSVSPNAAVGAKKNVVVTATSTALATKNDSVKATVTAA